MEILLISPDRVKEITVISDNTDEKYLLSSIREAQTIDFQQIIGQPLYEKLVGLIADEEIDETENADYKNLLDTAQYYLAYSVAEKLVVNTTYKISNIGLNTTSDDNVQIPSVNDVLRLRDEYTHKKDHFCLLLQNYLCEKYQDGKLKELTECNYHKIHSNLYSAASTNLWLGGARGKGYYGRKHNHRHC